MSLIVAGAILLVCLMPIIRTLAVVWYESKYGESEDSSDSDSNEET